MVDRHENLFGFRPPLVVALIVICVMGLLVSCEKCHGQVYPIRMVGQDRFGNSCQTFNSYGSSVSIGRLNGKQVFLTAEHCTQRVTQGEVLVNGVRYRWVGTPISVIDGIDMAIFSTQPIDGIKCARIGSMPAIGDSVVMAGFPGTGESARNTSGQIAKHGLSSQIIEINKAALSGESGGGVFNSRDEVIGIITHASGPNPLMMTSALAVGPDYMRAFVVKHLGGMPECGGEIIVEAPIEPTPDPGVPDRPTEPIDVTAALDRMQRRIDELEKQTQQGFRYEVIDPNGKVTSKHVKPGDTLRIRQVPVQVK